MTRYRLFAPSGATPPPQQPLLRLGVFNGDPDGTEASFEALESTVGHPFGVRRSYDTGMSSSWPAGADTGKRASWYSCKATWTSVAAGSYDNTIQSLIGSIPAGHDALVTYSHEPENDGGNAADWRAAFQHFYTVAKAVRPETLIGPCLMEWTFNSGSGRNPQDWNVGASYCDFYAADVYNNYHWPMVGSPDTWNTAPAADYLAFLDFCDSVGVPPAVGEFASAQKDGDPTAKPTWINSMVNTLAGRGGIAACYFNINKPGDTSASMLLTSDSESINAYTTLLNTYTAGVGGTV